MTDSRPKSRFRPTALAAALGLACAPGAPAADFFVNSYFEDAHDLAINGLCDTTSGGHVCTLRAAIEEAKASTSSDTIFLGTGTTTLSLGPLPDHEFPQGPLTLIGNGHLASSIVGSSPAGGRMITSTEALVLRGLRVAGFSDASASAITVDEGGSLWVESSVFEQNESANCGASIRALEGSELHVIDTAFAHGDGFAGEIEVRDSTFTCDGCVFEGGTGSFGGALYLNDDTGLLDARIENSLFAGNSALYYGGAIYVTGAFGSGSVLILNSTIAGNSTEGYGGGVWVDGPTVRIQSSTIVGNVGNSDLTGGEKGGGVAVDVMSASVALANSIVSGNRRCSAGTHGGGCTDHAADDCSGSLTSNGFNVVRTVLAAQCTVTGAYSTANPGLLPLAYYGGSTRTMALPPESPAKDAGDPAGCQDDSSVLLSDQRGAPRPAPGNGLCDLGAFENGALVFDDDFELWEWKWSDVVQ